MTCVSSMKAGKGRVGDHEMKTEQLQMYNGNIYFLKYNLTYFKLMTVFWQLYHFNVRKENKKKTTTTTTKNKQNIMYMVLIFTGGLKAGRWLRCCPTWGATKSHSKTCCSKRVLIRRLSLNQKGKKKKKKKKRVTDLSSCVLFSFFLSFFSFFFLSIVILLVCPG